MINLIEVKERAKKRMYDKVMQKLTKATVDYVLHTEGYLISDEQAERIAKVMYSKALKENTLSDMYRKLRKEG